MIKQKKADDNGFWCVVRDFNAIRKLEERRGLSQLNRRSKKIIKFNIFIQETNLLDIPMIGVRYMSYSASELAKSRLYRILVT